MTGRGENRAEVEAAHMTDAAGLTRDRIRRLRGSRLRRAATMLAGFRDPRLNLSDDQVGAIVDQLSPRRRLAVMEAVHPTLGPLLARAWDDLRSDPYTIGYARRGFRAPTDAATTRSSRARYVTGVAQTAGSYHEEVAWFARWAPHLGWGAESTLGRLFGVAIDAGDAEVRQILEEAATSGGSTMGRHVPVGLLSAADPSGWEVVVRLLLAAQRQEGLRQSILEAADLAHAGALARLLEVIRDEDLVRFAATVRAVGVWVGTEFDVRDKAIVRDVVDRLGTFLTDDDARAMAIRDVDAGEVRLALWSTAFLDAHQAIREAVTAARSADPDLRLVAAELLAATQLPEAHRAVVGAMGDDDLRVAAVALQAVGWQSTPGADTFAALWALLHRIDRTQSLSLGTWKPQPFELKAADVADRLVRHLGDRDPGVLDPVVERMSASGRAAWVRELGRRPDRHRDRLLTMLQDRATSVATTALRELDDLTVRSSDAPILEGLLTRQSPQLRQGVVGLLLRQRDSDVLASVERLRAATANQRRAAVDLLRGLHEAERATDDVIAAAREIAAQLPADAPEREVLALLLGDGGTVDDSVLDHRDRTRAPRPDPPEHPWREHEEGIVRVLRSLDRWITEHRDVEVTITRWSTQTEMLLGDVRHLAVPMAQRPWDDQVDQFPLPEIVEPWWEQEASGLTDGGLEVALAAQAVSSAITAISAADRRSAEAHAHQIGIETAANASPDWAVQASQASPAWPAITELANGDLVFRLLVWLAARELRPSWVPALLDVAVIGPTVVPTDTRWPLLAELREHVGWEDRARARRDPRIEQVVSTPLRHVSELEQLRPNVFDATQRERLWALARYHDEPDGPWDGVTFDTVTLWGNHTIEVPHRPARERPPLALAVRAHEDGIATRSDIVDILLARAHGGDFGTLGQHTLGDGLAALTGRRRHPLLDAHPWLAGLVDELRDELVERELHRGELPTPTTEVVGLVRTVTGAAWMGRLLAALGSGGFQRGYSWGGDTTRKAVFSRLLRNSFPDRDQAVEDVASAVGRTRERRLVELAVYAPQWATLLEAHLGWSGLADGVHWIHAHTKDRQWTVDDEVREEWQAQTMERTALRSEDLLEGAVDVAWFHQTVETLGWDRFEHLLKAAKYASSSGGHKRAELYARALSDTVDREDLDRRVEAKRQQDAVRALGLLPLPDEPDAAENEVLARYERLQAWRRAGRSFGQQRRANEAIAVQISLDNLARTAGYPDPQRLQWAMEARAVADLAAGPVTATAGDVTISLSITEDGSPDLAVRRGDRSLKHVPKDAKKNPDVASLRDRVRSLRDQARRMRTSLEETMIRGDRFRRDELAGLLAHPVLRPQLTSLVLVSPHGQLGRLTSPDAWADHTGRERPLDADAVRIAHPCDLLNDGSWSAWQHRCFTERLRQPCKQVFRELYLVTDQERADGTRSRRFAGQQVNPGQATALLGSRGWVVHREEGAMRTFHREGITVLVTALNLWGTPGEVDDLTLNEVWFRERGRSTVIALEDVPPRLFSEVMRDLDLVVSVAHAGDVDPEATASTVEMRGTLVRETAELLSLDNVELTDHHAMITGALNGYTVHLGSGTVHRRPGGAVCIIPVGSQSRGRVFLPFVDDDPRTAEVVSKVVMLARDDQIKDPTILEQLR